jgi:hypothetical protein
MSALASVDLSNDLPANYLTHHSPLPERLLDAPSLSLLLKQRLEARMKAEEEKILMLSKSEALFRRYTVRLVLELVEATVAHEDYLPYFSAPVHADHGYGFTIARSPTETSDYVRIVMAQHETPDIARMFHAKCAGTAYSLSTVHARTTSAGFTRSYANLLEDLAAWLVGDVA